MIPAMFPDVIAALPHVLACERATVNTALGPYRLGGENGDRFPRVAVRADGKDGPIAYLASTPEAAGKYALVVHPQGPLTIVKRFYAGIPTDRRLTLDIIEALADNKGIMALDAEHKQVMFAFLENGSPPPPAQSGTGANGSMTVAGPQFLILNSGDAKLVEPAETGMRHRPSGFACPSTIAGVPATLATIDPRPDYLSCSYRAGTDLAFQKDAPMRYQINLTNPTHGETPKGAFDMLVASAPQAFHVKGNHKPPLAAGAIPSIEYAASWDTEDGQVQALWFGKAGTWLAWVRAQYPAGAGNDAEAGKAALALFTQAARQMK